jgi:phytoene/squalene synthetase
VFLPLAAGHARAPPAGALARDLLTRSSRTSGIPTTPTARRLLDYCRRSANPIGRLLLHLYGITMPPRCARSDAICSALQLINFWQDLSVDCRAARCYVPQADAERHGLRRRGLARRTRGPAERALVRELCGGPQR